MDAESFTLNRGNWSAPGAKRAQRVLFSECRRGEMPSVDDGRLKALDDVFFKGETETLSDGDKLEYG